MPPKARLSSLVRNFAQPLANMHMLTSLRYLLFCFVVLLAGCYFAPSTTGWNKTPKIVVQVCIPSTSDTKAEIVFYRSPPLPSPVGLGFFHSPKNKTIKGQDVFEFIFEDPSPFHDAIGVHVKEVAESFYVFAIPQNYSSDWSPWVNPIALEDEAIKRIDRFKYMRGKKQLDAGILKSAPKIRTRLEYPADYHASSKSSLRYENTPECS